MIATLMQVHCWIFGGINKPLEQSNGGGSLFFQDETFLLTWYLECTACGLNVGEIFSCGLEWEHIRNTNSSKKVTPSLFLIVLSIPKWWMTSSDSYHKTACMCCPQCTALLNRKWEKLPPMTHRKTILQLFSSDSLYVGSQSSHGDW